MPSFLTLARTAYDACRTFTRDGSERTIFRFRDDAPEWCTDLAQRVHDDCDMLLDDYRYQFVFDCLASLYDMPDDATADDARDQIPDWCDADVDETVSEYGWPDGGLLSALQHGQYREREEVYSATIEFLADLADDSDGE